MSVINDIRIVELRVLENLANRVWADGICTSEGAGQFSSLGLSQRMYADLLVTLYEDQLLNIEGDEIRDRIYNLETSHKPRFLRASLVSYLSTSPVFHCVSLTYRGLRRIDDLRDELRHDRVLERFGILLDGRYIVSDLIRFLESSNGAPVTLIFADVDDFKEFNTRYGYKAGDAVLRHVFTTAKRIIGNRGEVYRRGGEEIIAVLPYCELNVGENTAERLREEIANSLIAYEEQELHTTLSIGVAASPPFDPDGTSLETHAESALMQAKSEGKNRVITAR